MALGLMSLLSVEPCELLVRELEIIGTEIRGTKGSCLHELNHDNADYD